MNYQEYFNNNRNNIRFRVYWFIENDTVLVTSEKIGSSFLDNIVQKSKNKVLYFVIKKENDEKLFSFETEDYIFQILDITEKQYKIELNNFIDKSNELKYIFITRDPVEKFVSAFYQYVKDLRNGIFITMYDFFNGNQINNSFNLIEKSLIHVGINSLSMKNLIRLQNYYIIL